MQNDFQAALPTNDELQPAFLSLLSINFCNDPTAPLELFACGTNFIAMASSAVDRREFFLPDSAARAVHLLGLSVGWAEWEGRKEKKEKGIRAHTRANIIHLSSELAYSATSSRTRIESERKRPCKLKWKEGRQINYLHNRLVAVWVDGEHFLRSSQQVHLYEQLSLVSSEASRIQLRQNLRREMNTTTRTLCHLPFTVSLVSFSSSSEASVLLSCAK